MIPETRYARSGDTHIAYQVFGAGVPRVVLADQWFSHMDGQWDVPPLVDFRQRLGSFSRVLAFDRRGVGLSDPVPLAELPTIEVWIDDLRAVLDAAGWKQASLITNIGGALNGLVCAAAFPHRVSSLIVVDGFARFLAADDYPIGYPPDEIEQRLQAVEEEFGRGLMLDLFAPSASHDAHLRTAWSRYERQSASPGSARAMVRLIYETDVRHVLPTIQVPTLIIQHTDVEALPPSFGRYLAEHIPKATLVELRGSDSLIWAGNPEATLSEIQEFLTGVRPVPEPTRILTTVLFTDIADSTRRAAQMGDRRWRMVLAEHDAVVRRHLARGGGQEIKTTGDGFLATSDGPARAVRAAIAMRDELGGLDLRIRAGLHTGEIEMGGNDIHGLAVHIGARVASLAEPGQILASSTVRDLVAGSGIVFVDRGAHVLKGVPGTWNLLEVVR